MTGQVKSIWMDQQEDTRVYMELNWHEVEIDLELMTASDNGRLHGYAVFLEGPRVGQEIVLNDKICRMAIEKWSKETETEWY